MFSLALKDVPSAATEGTLFTENLISCLPPFLPRPLFLELVPTCWGSCALRVSRTCVRLDSLYLARVHRAASTPLYQASK